MPSHLNPLYNARSRREFQDASEQYGTSRFSPEMAELYELQRQMIAARYAPQGGATSQPVESRDDIIRRKMLAYNPPPDPNQAPPESIDQWTRIRNYLGEQLTTGQDSPYPIEDARPATPADYADRARLAQRMFKDALAASPPPRQPITSLEDFAAGPDYSPLLSGVSSEMAPELRPAVDEDTPDARRLRALREIGAQSPEKAAEVAALLENTRPATIANTIPQSDLPSGAEMIALQGLTPIVDAATFLPRIAMKALPGDEPQFSKDYLNMADMRAFTEQVPSRSSVEGAGRLAAGLGGEVGAFFVPGAMPVQKGVAHVVSKVADRMAGPVYRNVLKLGAEATKRAEQAAELARAKAAPEIIDAAQWLAREAAVAYNMARAALPRASKAAGAARRFAGGVVGFELPHYAETVLSGGEHGEEAMNPLGAPFRLVRDVLGDVSGSLEHPGVINVIRNAGYYADMTPESLDLLRRNLAPATILALPMALHKMGDAGKAKSAEIKDAMKSGDPARVQKAVSEMDATMRDQVATTADDLIMLQRTITPPPMPLAPGTQMPQGGRVVRLGEVVGDREAAQMERAGFIAPSDAAQNVPSVEVPPASLTDALNRARQYGPPRPPKPPSEGATDEASARTSQPEGAQGGEATPRLEGAGPPQAARPQQGSRLEALAAGTPVNTVNGMTLAARFNEWLESSGRPIVRSQAEFLEWLERPRSDNRGTPEDPNAPSMTEQFLAWAQKNPSTIQPPAPTQSPQAPAPTLKERMAAMRMNPIPEKPGGFSLTAALRARMMGAEVKPDMSTPAKVDAPVTDAPRAKEPWEMTREEYDATPAAKDVSYDIMRASARDAGKTPLGDDLRASQFTWEQWKNTPHESTPAEGPVNGKDIVALLDRYGSARGEHAIAVAGALRAGKPVPPEVLADYPDLAAKYASQAAPASASPEPRAAAPAETPPRAKEPWAMRRNQYIEELRNESDVDAGHAADASVLRESRPDYVKGTVVTTIQTKRGPVNIREEGGRNRAFYAESDGKIVGTILGEGVYPDRSGQVSLGVADGWEGLGIGSELQWQLRSRFPFHKSGGLSAGGEKLLGRTHKRFVEEALRAGKPVPPEVLADYPDLAAKYASQATTTPANKEAPNATSALIPASVKDPVRDLAASPDTGRVADVAGRGGQPSDTVGLPNRTGPDRRYSAQDRPISKPAPYEMTLDEWRPSDAFRPISETEPGRGPVFDISLHTRKFRDEIASLPGVSVDVAPNGKILVTFDRSYPTADAQSAADAVMSRTEGRDWDAHKQSVIDAINQGKKLKQEVLQDYRSDADVLTAYKKRVAGERPKSKKAPARRPGDVETTPVLVTEKTRENVTTEAVQRQAEGQAQEGLLTPTPSAQGDTNRPPAQVESSETIVKASELPPIVVGGRGFSDLDSARNAARQEYRESQANRVVYLDPKKKPPPPTSKPTPVLDALTRMRGFDPAAPKSRQERDILVTPAQMNPASWLKKFREAVPGFKENPVFVEKDGKLFYDDRQGGTYRIEPTWLGIERPLNKGERVRVDFSKGDAALKAVSDAAANTKFKKQPITVKLEKGKPSTFDANVSGDLAYHRPLDKDGKPGRGGGYVITHIPTGRVISRDIGTAGSAKEVIASLQRFLPTGVSDPAKLTDTLRDAMGRAEVPLSDFAQAAGRGDAAKLWVIGDRIAESLAGAKEPQRSTDTPSVAPSNTPPPGKGLITDASEAARVEAAKEVIKKAVKDSQSRLGTLGGTLEPYFNKEFARAVGDLASIYTKAVMRQGYAQLLEYTDAAFGRFKEFLATHLPEHADVLGQVQGGKFLRRVWARAVASQRDLKNLGVAEKKAQWRAREAFVTGEQVERGRVSLRKAMSEARKDAKKPMISLELTHGLTPQMVNRIKGEDRADALRAMNEVANPLGEIGGVSEAIAALEKAGGKVRNLTPQQIDTLASVAEAFSKVSENARALHKDGKILDVNEFAVEGARDVMKDKPFDLDRRPLTSRIMQKLRLKKKDSGDPFQTDAGLRENAMGILRYIHDGASEPYQMIENFFGRASKVYDYFFNSKEGVRAGDTLSKEAEMRARDPVEKVLVDLGMNRETEEAKFRTEKRKFKAGSQELTLTGSEALDLYNHLRASGGNGKRIKENGFKLFTERNRKGKIELTDQDAQSFVDNVPENIRRLSDAMMESGRILHGYWARMYERIFGVRAGDRGPNYWSIMTDTSMRRSLETTLDKYLPTGDLVDSPFTKARAEMTGEPMLITDGLAKWRSMVTQQSRYAGLAEPLLKMRAIINHPDVRDALVRKYGQKVLDKFNTMLEIQSGFRERMGGPEVAGVNKWIKDKTTSVTGPLLAGSLRAQVMSNVTGALQYMKEVDARDFNTAAYGLAKDIAAGRYGALREALKENGYLHNRLDTPTRRLLTPTEWRGLDPTEHKMIEVLNRMSEWVGKNFAGRGDDLNTVLAYKIAEAKAAREGKNPSRAELLTEAEKLVRLTQNPSSLLDMSVSAVDARKTWWGSMYFFIQNGALKARSSLERSIHKGGTEAVKGIALAGLETLGGRIAQTAQWAATALPFMADNDKRKDPGRVAESNLAQAVAEVVDLIVPGAGIAVRQAHAASRYNKAPNFSPLADVQQAMVQVGGTAWSGVAEAMGLRKESKTPTSQKLYKATLELLRAMAPFYKIPPQFMTPLREAMREKPRKKPIR